MPIALTEREWGRIKQWAVPNREKVENTQRREYIKYLNNASHEMTKNWSNSVENVNKRNEELRLARLAAAEKANTKFYKRYLKKKKEEEASLMYSARDLVFKNRDAPKLLLSAVIQSVVLKERMEQIKFANKLRQQEMERKRKDDDEIIQQAHDWNKLMALKTQRRFEANKQYQKEILEQANEVAERKRKAYEAELNMQKIDNMNAKAEIDAIKKFDAKYREQEKLRILKDMEQAKAENLARKEEQAARDKMDDKLIQVLNKSRANIERRRKQTELDLKNEKQRVLEEISSKLQSGDDEREAIEEAIRQKDIKEKMALEDARLEEEKQKKLKNKQERIDLRKEFLRDEQQRIHEFNVRQQFQVMNRFKNAEIFEDFKENLRREKDRKTKEYREEILRLWKERDDREARERAANRYFYGELAEKKLRDQDNKVLTLAAHLLAEAKEHGRPDLAIHRTVDQYCKMYRLYPMPPLYDPIAEHMPHYEPKDGSRPDPDYVYPQQPQSTLEKEDELQQPGARRDGLQGTDQAGVSKPNKQSTSGSDYKKIGPANGLQRQADFTLPPIAVVPCKNQDCHCELNPNS